jgi:hypothetical protein
MLIQALLIHLCNNVQKTAISARVRYTHAAILEIAGLLDGGGARPVTQ